MIKGFKAFIFRGNVVDLAIAVVVGTAFTAVVKAFVADLMTPFIAAIVGKPNFGALKFTIHHSVFTYGDLINNMVTFLFVAMAVYFVIVVPMNKFAEKRSRGVVEEVELPPDVVLLTEIRDLLKGTQNETSAS